MARSRNENINSIRKLIIDQQNSGKSIQNIVKLAILFHSAVQYIIKNFKKENPIKKKKQKKNLSDKVN